eukprot:6214832-Pleurochrysis_carterae.AAC.4
MGYCCKEYHGKNPSAEVLRGSNRGAPCVRVASLERLNNQEPDIPPSAWDTFDARVGRAGDPVRACMMKLLSLFSSIQIGHRMDSASMMEHAFDEFPRRESHACDYPISKKTL